LIANVSIVSGSTILVGGGDQKIVLQAADSINVSTSPLVITLCIWTGFL
jgi:hypothetical protein